MARQKTHTQRQYERAEKKKRERREQPEENRREAAEIPGLNLRIAISFVLTLLAIAVALKCYEVPIMGSEENARLNIASVGIDDANIFMTYASNVVQGHGAVYYPSGPRVEGYSSPLFMMLCAVGFLVTSHVEFYLLLLNALLLCGVLITVQSFIHGLAKESVSDGSSITQREMLVVNWAATVLLWAWMVASPPFIIWTTVTMMDVALWTFVFVSGSVAAARLAIKPTASVRPLAVWIVAMLLTRPEAFYLCLIWIVAIVIVRFKQGCPFSEICHRVKGLLAIYLVTVVCLTAGRYFYFGYPLPNTYYAKVSSDLAYNLKLGIGYFIEFAKAQPWAAVVLLLNVVLLIKTLRQNWQVDQSSEGVPSSQQATAVLACISVLAVVAPILTGGDHFNYFRFFQPYWPVMVLAGIYYFRKYFLIESLPTMRKPIRVGITTLALAATMMLAQKPPWTILAKSPGAQPTLANEFQLALGGRQLGDLLNRWQDELQSNVPALDEKMSLGTLTTGGIGFSYQGPVLDMLGLNYPDMAHSDGDRRGNKNHAAFNKDVFFAQPPQLFAPRSRRNKTEFRSEVFPFQSANDFWMTSLKNLHTDSRFVEQYVPIELVEVTDNNETASRCTVWAHQSVITLLQGVSTDHFSFTVLTD